MVTICLKSLPDEPGAVAVVSASSYTGGVIAPNSIASLFGNALTTSPGLFTADATGKGLAAAVAIRVMPDGSTRYEPVWQLDAGGKPAPVPIDLKAGGKVYLILFGSGLRGGDTLSSFALVNY